MEKYIGIPYKHNGRDTHGLDCYGLVWLVEKEVFNKDIPKLSDLDDKTSCRLINDNLPLVDATEVENPEDGDIVLFFYHNNPIHVGIYYNKKILHANKRIGVIYESIKSRNLSKYGKKEFYRV